MHLREVNLAEAIDLLLRRAPHIHLHRVFTYDNSYKWPGRCGWGLCKPANGLAREYIAKKVKCVKCALLFAEDKTALQCMILLNYDMWLWPPYFIILLIISIIYNTVVG